MLTELGLSRLWHDDPERTWIVGRPLVSALLGIVAPSYGYGVERVPVEGAAVVAANHFSTLDPMLVGIYSRRTIYYMAKIELLDVPVAGEILRWMGAFAVRRGEGDRDALRVARWVLQQGHVVGMFMEGTRQKLGYPGPGQPGAAMLAIQEGVPLVPCGIDTFQWSIRNPRRCALVWGEPIDLTGLPRTGRGYKQGAAIVEAEIIRLWRLGAAAIAVGFPSELSDGTKRDRAVRPWSSVRLRGAQPWPDEPWAEGPLGPVYRANR